MIHILTQIPPVYCFTLHCLSMVNLCWINWYQSRGM